MRTNERTRANSMMSLSGLVRKSSAPACRPLTRSRMSLSAVTMTTGICAVRAVFLIRRQTSNPSMPGIMTSSSTRSGISRATVSSAVGPSWAVRTS